MRTTGRAPFDGRMPDTTGAEGSFALDAKTEALLHLAVLIALGASHPAYRQVVDDGRAAGAAVDDLVAVLTTVASHVGGCPRLVVKPRRRGSRARGRGVPLVVGRGFGS